MTIKQNIKIVKVPLSNSEKMVDRQQVFPRMPRLYLELLENKAKIKQDLINKEYSPKKSLSPEDNNFESKLDKFLKNDKEEEIIIEEENKKEKYKDKDKHKDKHKHKDKKSKHKEEDIDKNEDEEYYKKDKYKDNDSKDNHSSKKDKYKEDDSEDDDYKKDKYKEDDSEDDDYKKDKHKYKEDDSEDDDYKKDKHKYKEDDSEDDDYKKDKHKYKEDDSSVENLSVRLNDLLDDKDDDRESIISDKYSRNKYSKHRGSKISSSVREYTDKNIAPSLAELEAQGGYKRKNVLRDVNNVSYNEQEEEDLKREIMFKIELLKKSYPTANIQEFSIHSDYSSMKRTYDDTVRRLSLDSTVEQYKTYLIGGFMACEFILGNFFKLEMQGFTQQQILSMNSYEKLLIELGEKSYVPTGSKWPVELRLLFMIIMNAAFFLISKMIMKKTGANLMGMINSMNTTHSSHQPPSKKRSMKGPNIDISDLPEI
jgi:hypothetical protein